MANTKVKICNTFIIAVGENFHMHKKSAFVFDEKKTTKTIFKSKFW